MDISALPGLKPFLDPLAFAIVGGGTVLAVILRTPLADLRRGIAALRTLGRSRFDAEPLLTQIAALSRIAQRHGIIALDRSVIADRDVAAGVEAAVDGRSSASVALLLEECLRARAERHRAAQDMWSGAAEIAPAMGMIGTLIGLVSMFVSMKDPGTIGAAMAIALLTTLYGAILASLIAAPIAARLKRLARHEMQERLRLIAPLSALADISPVALRTTKERAA